MFENLGFFEIQIYSEYRKHGFIKVGGKKSVIFAISENLRFPPGQKAAAGHVKSENQFGESRKVKWHVEPP